MRKYNIIDLFSGCGGLLDGFMQSERVNHVASVEWEIAPVNTLRKRMKDKWSCNDSDDSVIRFDIQRTEELLNGFDDPKYGKSKGLFSLAKGKDIDFIIGGPPCQAYSVAGSIDKEAVRRESLYPQGYPEGLNDLILLYSTGYDARDYVHGYNKKKGRYMWSIPHRPQNDFLEKAVEEFNQKYNSGATWGELKPPYGGDTTI